MKTKFDRSRMPNVVKLIVIGALAAAPLPATSAEVTTAVAPADLPAAAPANWEIVKPTDPTLFQFSYASPTSPVLPLVAVGDDQITRVTDPRKFGVAAMTNIAGGSGGALAIDLSPYWLASKETMNLESFRDTTFLQRAFIRSSVGIAFSGGSSDVAKPIPSSLVLSVATKLLRSNDPLARFVTNPLDPAGPKVSYFEACFNNPKTNKLFNDALTAGKAARQAAIAENLPASEQSDAFRAAQAAVLKRSGAVEILNAQHATCTSKLKADLQQRSSLDVGFGYRMTGDAGSLNGLSGSGSIFWATFSSADLMSTVGKDGEESNPGLGARLAFHGRYVIGETAYDKNAVPIGKADSALLVAGLESVPPEDGGNFRWSLQGGWTSQGAPTPTTEKKDFWRFLANAALKVGDGFWLTGTVGRVQGQGVADDNYVLAGVAFSPPARDAGFVAALGGKK